MDESFNDRFINYVVTSSDISQYSEEPEQKKDDLLKYFSDPFYNNYVSSKFSDKDSLDFDDEDNVWDKIVSEYNSKQQENNVFNVYSNQKYEFDKPFITPFNKMFVTSSNTTSSEVPTRSHYKPSKETENYRSFENFLDQAIYIDPKLSSKRDFLTAIADTESKFISQQNSSGAEKYGYFQMGKWEIELTKGLNLQKYITDPVSQIISASNLYDWYLSELKRIGAYDLGKEKGYSEEAMIAGAWLGGPGNVKKFLQGKGNASDYHLYNGEGGDNVGDRMDKFNKLFK